MDDSAAKSQDETSASVREFLLAILQMLSWRFVGLVLLTLLIGVVSGVSLVLLMPMLHVVGIDATGGAGKKIVEVVFSGLRALGLEPNLPTVLSINAIAVVATALLMRFQSIVLVRVIQTVVLDLRQRLYDNICQAEWLFIAGEQSARLTHILLGELGRVGAGVSTLVALLVSSGRVVVYTVIAVVLSPAMTLLTLGCGLLLSLLLLHQTRLGRSTGEAVSNAYGDLYSATSEHLAGLKYTKSHSLEERQAHAFRLVNDHVATTQVEVVRNQANVGFWLQAGTVIALSVIIYFAFAVLMLPLATVLLLIYLFSRLLPLLASVQRSYQTLLSLLPAFSNVVAALERSDAAREVVGENRRSIELERGIEFRDVTFHYRDESGPALDGLDLVLSVGKTTALVGFSGAGKSTVADMAIGLVSPQSGRVLIDGEPLTADRRRAWREQVAYVSQDVFLFHDTVRANLLMAKPGAQEQDLWNALEAASATFVGELSDGLETIVGDRGSRLSGGERQRLALARALLREPAFLVLDEATSSLDSDNEVRIREAVDRLSGRMTILVIAHRLATIRSAHVIHVLDGGRIVESGTWDVLLNRPTGRFRALATAQGLGGATAPAPLVGARGESLPR